MYISMIQSIAVRRKSWNWIYRESIKKIRKYRNSYESTWSWMISQVGKFPKLLLSLLREKPNRWSVSVKESRSSGKRYPNKHKELHNSAKGFVTSIKTPNNTKDFKDSPLSNHRSLRFVYWTNVKANKNVTRNTLSFPDPKAKPGSTN